MKGQDTTNTGLQSETGKKTEDHLVSSWNQYSNPNKQTIN